MKCSDCTARVARRSAAGLANGPLAGFTPENVEQLERSVREPRLPTSVLLKNSGRANALTTPKLATAVAFFFMCTYAYIHLETQCFS